MMLCWNATASERCEIASQNVLKPSAGIKTGERGIFDVVVEHKCPAGFDVYIENTSPKNRLKKKGNLEYKINLVVNDRDFRKGKTLSDSQACVVGSNFGSRENNGCWLYTKGSKNGESIIKTKLRVEYSSSETELSKTVIARENIPIRYTMKRIK